MSELFADLPEALDAAWELSQRLDFTLADLGYRFPDYPLPPGETPDSYLRKVTWNGARTRFRPLTAKAQAQIAQGAGDDREAPLAGYFLIVWDIVQFCKREKILVQGRGSAANSAVCYALSHDRGRPGEDGAALRALPLRGARRMAGHRPRSSVGRSAREGHPARLREVRPARRRHDGQRHHLPRPLGRARGRQGARLLARAGGQPLQAALRLELRRDPRADRAALPARSGRRGSTPRTSARSISCGSSCRSRTCRGTSASTRAGWWSRRGGWTRSCRSSRPRCPAASSCSGTRTTARTSGSSRSTC